ncbi:MAG TPA: hypothetical protein VFU76_16995 [Terriglobales bacterium]|nr:hypothetical protein [Terriglobales bacterium]
MSTGVTASLRGLAIHGKLIWASGSGGTWLRSADDGKTWTHGVLPGAESQDFRGVAVLNKKTVLLMSSGLAEKNQAHIYRTTDTGAHWTEVFHGTQPGMFLDAIKFWDAKHGIVLSDPVNGKFAILLTDDGGKTWREGASDHMPAALPKEGAFAASNSALAVWGKSEAWFGTGGAGHGRVFHSSDHGRTWTVVDTPVAADTPASGIFSMLFPSSEGGIAVGGNYEMPSAASANVALTYHGPLAWRLAEEPPALYLSSVAFQQRRSNWLIAVGTAGWGYSLDDGHTWMVGGNEGFNAVSVLSSGYSIAVGGHGRLALLDSDAVIAAYNRSRTR